MKLTPSRTGRWSPSLSQASPLVPQCCEFICEAYQLFDILRRPALWVVVLREQRHHLLDGPPEAVADELSASGRPRHLHVGHVEGNIIVQIAELARDGLGAADDEIDGMAQRSSGGAGSGVAAGILPSAEIAARGSEGPAPRGQRRVHRPGRRTPDGWRRSARAARRAVGGTIFPVLLRRPQVGEEHVEIERSRRSGPSPGCWPRPSSGPRRSAAGPATVGAAGPENSAAIRSFRPL